MYKYKRNGAWNWTIHLYKKKMFIPEVILYTAVNTMVVYSPAV